MPAFDVAGARKAGYDDKEILSYVAGEENPDLLPGTDAEKIRLLLARNGKHMLDVEYLSPTQLEPMQEVQFQDWAKRNKVRLEPGWNEDYDMRGLWKANPGAVPDPQGQWPDTYKLPNHPTFSSQSIYALPELPAPKLPQGLSGPPASVPGSVPQTGERRNLTPQEQDALWSEQGIQPTLPPTSLLDMAMLATSGPEQDAGIPLSMLAAVRNPDKKASLLNMVRGFNDPWRDMMPEVEKQGLKPAPVPAPKAGETWYHGRRGDIAFSEERPAFFSRSREGAEWYSQERGDRKATPTVGEYQLDIHKPARLRDLHEAVTEAGVSAKDIQSASPYEGDSLIDYLYVPKVREALKRKGFDGYVGWDTLEQDDIQIAVPFTRPRSKK